MGYEVSHKKILNELKNFNYIYHFYVLHDLFKLNYNINNNKIEINYLFEYPIKTPIIYINKRKLIDIYNYLIINNNKYLNSINCIENLNTSITLICINKELNKIIRLIQFNTEKLLLKKIIEKYSKENMDYLYDYLLI